MDKKQAIKKAVLLFVAEFVVWMLAALVIGSLSKGSWKALLTNSNFLILAGVFSLFSAFFDYMESTGRK